MKVSRTRPPTAMVNTHHHFTFLFEPLVLAFLLTFALGSIMESQPACIITNKNIHKIKCAKKCAKQLHGTIKSTASSAKKSWQCNFNFPKFLFCFVEVLSKEISLLFCFSPIMPKAKASKKAKTSAKDAPPSEGPISMGAAMLVQKLFRGLLLFFVLVLCVVHSTAVTRDTIIKINQPSAKFIHTPRYSRSNSQNKSNTKNQQTLTLFHLTSYLGRKAAQKERLWRMWNLLDAKGEHDLVETSKWLKTVSVFICLCPLQVYPCCWVRWGL